MWKEKARHSGAIRSKQRRWTGNCIAPNRTFFLEWTYTTSKAEPPTAPHLCRSALFIHQHAQPTSSIQAPLAEEDKNEWNGIMKTCLVHWKGMHSTMGLRSYWSLIGRWSIVSHFTFKFWITFSLDRCWSPWLSSVLSFVLVIKKKNLTYKGAICEYGNALCAMYGLWCTWIV